MGVQFYVYTLADPRDGAVFYVGKGKNRRAWAHIQAAKAGRHDRNQRKLDRILAILASGLEPIVAIVRYFKSENWAYRFEEKLIGSLSGLTNIVRGGRVSYKLTAEERQRREQIRAEYGDRPRPAASTGRKPKQKKPAWEYLERYLRMWDSWPDGVTFPGMPDGDRIATEYVEGVRSLLTERYAFEREKAASANG